MGQWIGKISYMPSALDDVYAADYVQNAYPDNWISMASDGNSRAMDFPSPASPIAYADLGLGGADINGILRVTARVPHMWPHDGTNPGGGVVLYGPDRNDALFWVGNADGQGRCAVNENGVTTNIIPATPGLFPDQTLPGDNPFLTRIIWNGTENPYVIYDEGFGLWEIAANSSSFWSSPDDGVTWARAGDRANDPGVVPTRAGICGTVTTSGGASLYYSNLEVMQGKLESVPSRRYSFGASGQRAGTQGPNKPDRVIQTYYLDPVSGNDDNDGLSSGNAIKTFDHFWNNVLPDVVTQRYTLVVAAGTVPMSTGPNAGVFDGKRFENGRLVIEGDPTLDFTGSGGPMTVNTTDDWSYTFSPSPGWTVNEHAGKMLYNRTQDTITYVWRNTSDTLYLYWDYTSAIGDEVEFCSYSSILDGYAAFEARGLGGAIWFSEIALSGTKYFSGDLTYDLSYVNTSGTLRFYGKGRGEWRPTALIYEAGHVGNLFFDGCVLDLEYAAVGGDVDAKDCDLQFYYSDCFFAGTLTLDHCDCREDDGIGSFSLDANGSDYPIHIKNCPRVRLYDDITIVNPGANGIYVQNSQLIVSDSSLTGAPTSYGVVLRHGARLRLKSGATPTLNGTTADIYDNNGTSTWAAVQGGTPLVNTNEMTSAVLDDIAFENE